MKVLLDGLHLILKRKDSRIVAFVASVLFIIILLAFQNGKESFDVLGFSSLPLIKRLSLFASSFFDVSSSLPLDARMLAVLGSCIGGINLSLAYTYIRLRGEVILKSGVYSGIGLLFAFLGIGCAACGSVFLSTILGFFGAGALVTLLPYHGQEVGYLGVFFLSIATYSLAKKVVAPYVC